MNAQRLLQHFKRIAEAPDAVPRLRRFILDLAVRRKLVEQDSKDEPASELLKRIEAEKARLVKAREIKKLEPFEPVDRTKSLSLFQPAGRLAWISILNAQRSHEAQGKFEMDRQTAV